MPASSYCSVHDTHALVHEGFTMRARFLRVGGCVFLCGLHCAFCLAICSAAVIRSRPSALNSLLSKDHVSVFLQHCCFRYSKSLFRHSVIHRETFYMFTGDTTYTKINVHRAALR